jgi:hypothetical protein
VTGEQSISVSYVANDLCDNSGGHFALFFTTATKSQFDFEKAVPDAIDAIPIGDTKAIDYAPLRVTVQHPTAAKWQFKVDQSA